MSDLDLDAGERAQHWFERCNYTTAEYVRKIEDMLEAARQGDRSGALFYMWLAVAQWALCEADLVQLEKVSNELRAGFLTTNGSVEVQF